MKTKIILVTLTSFVVTLVASAQKPSLSLTSQKELILTGHTNNYYLIKSSTNLVDWNAYGSLFSLQSTTYTQIVGASGLEKEFFRLESLMSSENETYQTLCAENDNVAVYFFGDIDRFSIIATHPTYTVTNYSLQPDFTNCDSSHVYTNYSFTPRNVKIFDGGFYNDTVWSLRESSFWRPSGMTVTVNSNMLTMETNMQQIVLYRYIPNSSGQWPSFLVLYCDGNMRLIPFPPEGHGSVSYGSSVIIGPSDITFSTDGLEPRPVCDIQSVDYRTATKTMLISYKNGGSAILDVNMLTRTQAVVQVAVKYTTTKPVCVLRSNFVSEQKCDTSTVIWKDLQNNLHVDPVGSFIGLAGNEWFFTRPTPSVTRNSSPDIRIVAQ